MVDSNVVDFPERDVDCACRSGRSLEILKVVQRVYEDRLVAIDRAGGARKLQQQVEVLRSWVSDLVAQNTLLTRAVEDLESDATATILERRRHAEIELEWRAECAVLRRRLMRKDSDLRGLIEVVRRMRDRDVCTAEGIHFHEVTESDILGSEEWPYKKLAEGDITSKRKTTSRYFTLI